MTDDTGTDRRQMLLEALNAIDDLQARLDEAEGRANEPIAIIGMACRFPGGADTPDRYWELLRSGRDAVAPFPESRLALLAEAGIDLDADEDNGWRGGFVDDVDQFDASFFGMSPREASSLDPQQRMVLETSWEALERAAIAPDSLRNSATGVFVGITGTDYVQLGKLGGPDSLDVYSATGGALNAAPGRVAYTLGLQGPSMAIDTACSSSLVALHQACISLRTGESDLALAGGVNLLLLPEAFLCFERWGMMAPDGRCKTFDADADGFVRGEGCGMVTLKRQVDAIADGDPILAVIRGSAVNQDGASSGLTVPNGPAQEAVIRKALTAAGVKGSDIQYFEAHGTGTSLGDPIEVEALGAALGPGRRNDQVLRLGSVKTNLGHLESAAGMAGVMKVVLAMQHGEVPPHLHLGQRNPDIPWPDFSIDIPTVPVAWDEVDGRRLAGVSGFGFSGTNAHLIIESAPVRAAAATQDLEPASASETELTTEPRLAVLPLSAGSPTALGELARQVAEQIDGVDRLDFADIAGSLATGRAGLPHRLAVIHDGPEAANSALVAFADGQPSDAVIAGDGAAGRPRVGFIYTGQGSQYPEMAASLYAAEPVFAAAFDDVIARFDPILAERQPGAAPLRDIIDGRPDPALIHQTGFTQPALFALQHALTQLWASWGVTPAAVLGHSIGELAAAVTAGVLSLDDGVVLVAARASLMQGLPAGGAMASVDAPVAEVEAVLAAVDGPVAVAGINGPMSTVISGRSEVVEEVGTMLADLGRRVTGLEVSHAFHSPLMAPMLEPFRNVASSLAYASPRLPIVSNVTGAMADATMATADYWVDHVAAPVRFADGIAAMAGAGIDTYVEIGPHPVLSSIGQAAMRRGDARWLPSLRRNRDGHQQILRSLAELHLAGAPIDWSATQAPFTRVVAPTTPFDRRSHWFQPVPRRPRSSAVGSHPLAGPATEVAALAARVHEQELTIDSPAWLADHRLGGTVVFPGTGYVELVLAATAGAPIASLTISEPMVLGEDTITTVQTTVADGPAGRRVTVSSRTGDGWATNAVALVGTKRASTGSEPEPLDLSKLPELYPTETDVVEYYQRLRDLGIDYGPAFTGVTELRNGPDGAVSRVELADGIDVDDLWVHPAMLDACFHTLGVAIDDEIDDEIAVPVALHGVEVAAPLGTSAWCRVDRVEVGDGGTITARIALFDDDGRPTVTIEALEVRPTPRSMWARLGGLDPNLVQHLVWRGQERGEPGSQSTWIVAAADRTMGAALVDALPGSGSVVGLDPAEVDAELARLGQDRGSLEIVALLAGLGVPAAGGAAEIDAADAAGSAWSLAALAKVVASHQTIDVRLSAVTRLGVSVEGEPPSAVQAAAWGCGAVLATELGPRWGGLVDLDLATTDDGAGLAAELVAAERELAVALRGGRRHVARLRGADRGAPQVGPRKLVLAERGSLDNLTLEPLEADDPGPGQIAVAVRATGLNFRDVLNALGMMPGEPGPPGLECAGVVTAVGDGVQTHTIGDQVVGIAPRSFDDVVVTEAELMVSVPPSLTFAQAATLPVAFLTASYGLDRLAGLQPGERVLIHAGAGGVGMAAVQLAMAIGAEVYATAGSVAKRKLLTDAGVAGVYDSRSLDFADELMADTRGEGVHVALNSLADDFVTATLGTVITGGRFLEIGKRGILSAEDAASRRPDVAYHPYDLADFLTADPTDLGRELERIARLVDAGELRSLPIRSMSLDRIGDAFRYMAQARHVGKVIVDHHRVDDPVRPDGTYLVTGGLGGIGLAMARWLGDGGAGRVVLAGRSDPGPEAAAAIDRLRDAGVDVVVRSLDVADAGAVAALIGDLADADRPLRGVAHAAGITDDGALIHQTAERFAKVAEAKVAGAEALDRATRTVDLDWFVLFSSASALLGAAGQANYASANRAIDAIAIRRRADGLPATTINWGAWAEAGMAARLPEAEWRRLADHGVRGLTDAEATTALESVLTDGADQVLVASIDWARFGDSVPVAARPLLSELNQGARLAAPVGPTVDLAAMLEAAAPHDRPKVVRGVVDDQVIAVLGLDPGEPIDADQGLSELGMDSLMAVELSNRLAAIVERDLPATLAFENPTPHLLANHLTDLVVDRLTGQGTAGDDPVGNDDLQTMDTGDLASALLDELNDVGY